MIITYKEIEKESMIYLPLWRGLGGWTFGCFSTPQPPPKGEINSRSNFSIICKLLLIK